MSRGRKRKCDETGFEKWGGYMAAKISKLQDQFENEAGKKRTGIFAGIAIFVNGYTDPTADELKRIMMNNGGTFHNYYSRSKTTHIIASNLPNTKIINSNTDFIVNPKWISESLKENRLLDYKKYLLYTNQSRSQPKLQFAHESEKDEQPEPSISNPFPGIPAKTEARSSSQELFYDEDDTNYKNNLNLNIIHDKDKELRNISSKSKHNPGNETLTRSSNQSENLTSTNRTIESNTGSSLDSEEQLSKTMSINLTNNDGQHERLSPELFLDEEKETDKKNLSNTKNPNFLSDFYNNSRLHHIATAGAMFKQYVKDLQDKEDNFSGKDYLANWMKRKTETGDFLFIPLKKVFMHIDMDCFFVSVGLRNRPELKNVPVAVTHAKGTKGPTNNRNENNLKQEIEGYKERFKHKDKRSIDIEEESETKRVSTFDLLDANSSMAEIASCSYEARKKGVKNGMLLGAAIKLCPELKTIPYDFEGYKTVSMGLYDIVASYTKEIEAVSCDEMFVDLTEVLNTCEVSPLDFSSCIRGQIQAKTKCPCSVGMGSNMLIARLATKKAKPNGQFWISHEDVNMFMKKQNVSDIPGVGWAMKKRLEDKNITTCEELQRLSSMQLQKEFGLKTGKNLHDSCRGIDQRTIVKDHKRKSVSAEVNYGIRFESWADAEKFIMELCTEVSSRLKSFDVEGRAIILKLKVKAENAPEESAKYMGHGLCDNIAKSSTLPFSTDDLQIIFKEVMSLLKQSSSEPKELRGIGIQIAKLEDKKNSCKTVSIKSFFTESKNKPFKKEKEKIEIMEEENNIKIPKKVDSPIKQNKIDDRKITNIFTSIKKKTVPQLPVVINPENSKTNLNIIENKKVIDMSVLKELPDDMREEIITEYKSHGYILPDTEVRVVSPQPGPSGINVIQNTKCSVDLMSNTSDDGKELTELEEIYDENILLNIEDQMSVSFSEIDKSFLEALPEDVKIELKKDIARKKEIKKETETKNFIVWKPQPETKKHRGGPRGSHSKLSRNNNIPQSKRIQRTTSPILGNSTKTILPTSPMTENQLIMKAENVCDSTKKGDKENLIDINLVPIFCGETELPAIKKIILEWIQSCSVPESYDVEMIVDYCTSLIKDKDLEKLDLFLKFLKRKVAGCSELWQNSYTSICNKIQCSMQEIYKSKLALN